jgi:hypothetical protein
MTADNICNGKSEDPALPNHAAAAHALGRSSFTANGVRFARQKDLAAREADFRFTKRHLHRSKRY